LTIATQLAEEDEGVQIHVRVQYLRSPRHRPFRHRPPRPPRHRTTRHRYTTRTTDTCPRARLRRTHLHRVSRRFARNGLRWRAACRVSGTNHGGVQGTADRGQRTAGLDGVCVESRIGFPPLLPFAVDLAYLWIRLRMWPCLWIGKWREYGKWKRT
jgi:hypothetical protein